MKFVLFSVVICFCMYSAFASDFVIDELDVAFLEDFNEFRGTSNSLPSGFTVWRNTQSLVESNAYRGVSSGGKSWSGCYAWEIDDDDIALGFQPSSTEFTPGYFHLVVSNASGLVVTDIGLSYKVVCFNDASRSQSIVLEVSLNGRSFLGVDDFDYTTPSRKDDSPDWLVEERAGRFALSGQLETNACVWLRWRGDDVGGSGSRDEIGIDDIRITLHQPSFDASLVSVW